jgi:RNA polymerase sigma-70 factor (ECF subfamily)
MDLDLKKLKNLDPAVFEEMVRSYEKKIYHIARKMVNDPVLSCDITQDVFIKIYQALPSFKENSSLSTWIYRIAVNVCIDYQRKRKRENIVALNQINEDREEYTIEVVDSAPSPEERYEKKELWEQIQKALMKLSCDHRAVIVLKDIEHRSYAEISEILQCNQGTVKSRLNRGREQLRALLAKDGNFFHKHLSNT